MSITGTNIIDNLIDRIPGLGWKFTGTATSGGDSLTTTDPEINKGGASGPTTRFDDLTLYIPTGTVGTDQIHSIDTNGLGISAATATIQTRGNYGATYTNAAMYILSINPDVLRRVINRALQEELTDFYTPLAHGPDDYDMQAANTTSWPNTSGVTVTNQTTNTEVFQGIRSKKALYSAAGYSQSTLVPVTPGKQILVWGIWKSDIGTNSLRVVDAADVEIDTISHTGEHWVLGKFMVTPSSSTEQIRLQLRGAANLDEGDWNTAAIVKLYNRRFNLMTWTDERWKVRGLARAVAYESFDNEKFEAFDYQELNLIEGTDYHVVIREGDANPFSIVIDESRTDLLSEPLFVIGQRPFSDFGTLSADTDTTNCPLRVVAARTMYLLGEEYAAYWPSLKQQAAAEINQRVLARFTRKPRQEIRYSRMFGTR